MSSWGSIEGSIEAQAAIETRVVAPMLLGFLPALMAGGKVFAEGCQEHAPVKTGWLRDHIHEDEAGPLEVVVKPHDTPYAIFQELGTYKMSPRPFMRFGYDTKKEEAVEAVCSFLKGVIR
jgi:HK97 gp10 family phage protein